MKHNPNDYARAFLEVLNDASQERRDEIIKNFAALIARKGDISAANKITAAVEKLWVRQNGGRMVKIETARAVDNNTLDQIKKNFPLPDHVEIKTNARLIAGIRIAADDTELDNSLAAKLNKIFA